jgi:hypothetical protein
MKKLVFIVLVAAAFVVTSCSTTLKSMQEPFVGFQFTADDIVLSEQVVGEATVTRVLKIDWARLFTNRFGVTTAPIIGATSMVSLDSMYAVYDLMEKHPGYDFVMYPQFESITEGVPGIFEKTRIKVVARLGKMK